MGGFLLSPKDVPILRSIIREYKSHRKNNAQTNRKRWQGPTGIKIRNAVISEKGDYNTHKVLLATGTFTEDLTTDDLISEAGETIAYVGEEFDYRIEVGDPVKVAKIKGKWWIIDAQQACRGYCIDDLESAGYVYGWRFNAPPLTCCPEASGSHILTTSDSGSTYESATFQCNSDGTNRKWIFNGSRLYLSPMLESGSVEYRTDRTVAFCSVELMQHESAAFPTNDTCGKHQQSVCIHPLCGTYSCDNCDNGAPVEYASSYSSTPLIMTGDPSTYNECDWRNYTGSDDVYLAVTTSPYIYVDSVVLYNLSGTFDCWGQNTFNIDDAVTYPDYPETITIYPNTSQTIESNCNPRFYRIIANGSTQLCYDRPFRYYIDPSGVTDGTCTGCTAFNAVTLISYEEDFTKGNFFNSAYISLDCGGAGNKFWRLVNYQNPGVDSGTRLTLESLSGSDIVTYETVNADENYVSADCWHGPITLDYVSDNGSCSTWPSTITVYPSI